MSFLAESGNQSMKDESKALFLTSALTACFAFLRVHSWELSERVGRAISDLFRGLSRPQRIALRATLTVCFALLFVYSWTHSGPPEYWPTGKRIVTWTLPLGAALIASVVSLLWELSGKE